VAVRLFTFNVGLLRFIGGRPRFAPFVEERLVYLPDQIRKVNAEIVALQEVYSQRHREWIVSELREVYPFVVYSRKRRNWGFGNGQMVLSKTPASGKLHLFKSSPIMERLIHNKGALLCDIETGDGYRLELANLHTTAGGLWMHSEAPRTKGIRAKQIKQVLATRETKHPVRLVVGDLNAGGGVSQENFDQLLEAGYVSAHHQLHGSVEEYTWEPQNRLNKGTMHRNHRPGLLDHVFVNRTDFESGRVRLLASSICCREEVVPVPDGSKVTVSDHYGLQVDMEFVPSST
jgi:endonuclease/exonuclease/phosphatase family metal-dependent hydrolase